MKPSLKQYEKGSTRWSRTHKGVSYLLSHHGISDYSPEGTWCFYIFIEQDMFLDDSHFSDFNLPKIVSKNSHDRYWQTYNYHDVPDYGFHGGITFYEKGTYIDKFSGTEFIFIKIGCDYNHSWDADDGYPDILDSVDQDARMFIDKLVQQRPVKTKCQYSGKLGKPDDFYKAKNGWTIHNFYKNGFDPDKDPELMPQEAA